MNGLRFFSVILLALIVGAVGYQMGVSQAVATAVPAAGAAPVAYYGSPYWHFGFGFFGFLFPLFFLFLIFGLLRAAMWGGRGGWKGHYGYGHGDPRSRLEELHRELHGEKPTTPGGPPPGTST